MFDKLKQLNELRKMKNAMESETVTVEESGVKITVNGSFSIEELIISPEAMNNDLGRNIKHCFNNAQSKIQRILAQKFSGLMN